MKDSSSETVLTLDDLKTRTTVNVRELASLLGCSKDALYESIAAGACPWPVLRIGRRIVLPAAPIMRDLLGGEAQGEAPRPHARDKVFPHIDAAEDDTSSSESVYRPLGGHRFLYYETW
jgi:predicted DNA-binding transcriptional regulator AlpA